MSTEGAGSARRGPARRIARRTLLAAVAGIGAGAAVATEAGLGRAATSRDLRIAVYQDVSQLDPMRSNDTGSSAVYDQLYDRLLVPDQHMQPIPQLAERFTASPDAKVWTFYLRRGVVFHDGGMLTADDVVFSLDRILDPKNSSQKRPQIDMISRVEAVDPSTVRITLQYSYSPFPAAIALQDIVSRQAAQKWGDQFTKHAVGSGPFSFVEWVPNDHVTLARNAHYWGQAATVERVVFRPIPEASTAAAELLSGGVDIVQQLTPGTLAQLRGAPGITIGTQDTTSYGYFGFRMYRPPFTDVRFREAVYRAWNLDAAVKAVFPVEAGRRAYACISPPIWPDDTAYLREHAYGYDPARAKTLFGQLMDSGAMPRDYTIKVISLADYRARLSEVLVSNLQQVGVRATLQITDLATLLNTLVTPDNYIFSLVGGGGAPDPDQTMYWLFHSGGSHATFMNIRDPELDARLLRARQATGREARSRLYTEIQRYVLLERIYQIPGYYLNNTQAWNRRVQGFQPAIVFGRWDLATPWNTVRLAG